MAAKDVLKEDSKGRANGKDHDECGDGSIGKRKRGKGEGQNKGKDEKVVFETKT